MLTDAQRDAALMEDGSSKCDYTAHNTGFFYDAVNIVCVLLALAIILVGVL